MIINHTILSKIQKQEREGRPSSGGITSDNRKETEEILNDILPPRCWEEDGQLWTQTVCLQMLILYRKLINGAFKGVQCTRHSSRRVKSTRNVRHKVATDSSKRDRDMPCAEGIV